MARKLDINVTTARRWRARFLEAGLDGLLDELRPGRPRTVADEQVEQVITRTLETTPKDATHWSTRSLAAELGMSQTTVSRIWRAFGLAPHRRESWKLSKDPQFIDKVPGVQVGGGEGVADGALDQCMYSHSRGVSGAGGEVEPAQVSQPRPCLVQVA